MFLLNNFQKILIKMSILLKIRKIKIFNIFVTLGAKNPFKSTLFLKKFVEQKFQADQKKFWHWSLRGLMILFF